ncbi:putative LRR receptor-like serine/threonine-protein kinase At1g51860 [Carex rostrata]
MVQFMSAEQFSMSTTRLYLSNNDLSGSLPSSLDNLTALKFLDIRGNSKLSTTLSPELQRKQQSGTLTYLFDNNTIPSPPPSHPSRPPSPTNNVIIIVIAIGVPLLVISVAIATFLWWRKYKRSIATKQNESYGSSPLPNYHAKNDANIQQGENPNRKPQSRGPEHIPIFYNHKFSYNDLQKITNDFKNRIGMGGFGCVYLGQLENGPQVAVKMLAQSSKQGVKEFLAEAQNLARVHHKNLVSLTGYCIDENCMALVYEYMQEGNLHHKLKDNETPLSWKQRLQIAYESALGLEYLHKACNPPLIHRDIKTSNILLNANLEAKIADFGLSRTFDNDAISHVSTRIVGTPGYLDPEYYLSNQLSVKSDVFSFGVVLLEIITGRPPNCADLGGNLVQWVHQKLTGGDIESVVDPRMQGKYDINSVWKVTELACRCTAPTSSQRPTMNAVVAELNESKYLEMSMEEIHIQSTTNLATDVSLDSNFEMAYIGGLSAPGPSVR